MSWFVFRNNTIERFFGKEYTFSGYDDVSVVPQEAEGYLWFYTQPLQADDSSVAEQILAYKQNLRYVLNQISATKPFIIFTMAPLYDAAITEGQQAVKQAIEEYNRFVYSLENHTVYVVDFSDFTKRYRQEDLVDWKFYFLTQIGLNPRLAGDFKQWFEARLNSIALKRKKCLVLDLDNTLWGGVLGEDGIEGIKCSGDYGAPIFFRVS